MASNLLIVESPAKARTINRYLGRDFTVLASFGHIRDLPPKDGSVKPDEDFTTIWETDSKSRKNLAEIVKACKASRTLYLATDPDREGEAISWHLLEELQTRKALTHLDDVHRVVFHEITKTAVQDAIAKPRTLDQELVDAYLARRVLDYLVGFTISPVLWRKLPGARSAGRVQSVALRLVCERQDEIDRFRAQEYWSIDAKLQAQEGNFAAHLTHIDGEKLQKHAITNAEQARDAAARVQAQDLHIVKLDSKQTQRRPQAPFTTSTLQQEASRKLRMSTAQTMRTAQRLYEGVAIAGQNRGLITYMRTDSVSLSNDAIRDIRAHIARNYTQEYLPTSARMYKTKTRNAQEAHEAIRPTDIRIDPQEARKFLEPDQAALYGLIWARTLASQMENARINQTSVLIASQDDQLRLQASGSAIAFDGYLSLYREGSDDCKRENTLPKLTQGEALKKLSVTPEQHFTQPPARYSEASLVMKMEELGIGRPSTYASILKVLQDRNYLELQNRRFVPLDNGRLVNAYLQRYFTRYVDYQFTADVEEDLDKISRGQAKWKQIVRIFWQDFSATSDGAMQQEPQSIRQLLDQDLEPMLFPNPDEDIAAQRQCKSCGDGRLALNYGRWGMYLSCSNYPDCRYTRKVNGDQSDDDEGTQQFPLVLGMNAEKTGTISVRSGPYGKYLQLDMTAQEEAPPKPGRKKSGKQTAKPKRISLPKGTDPLSLSLEQARAM
ncbi:MAG: type I DNA topoisomerase, partial [Pseudomonadota bacterium]